MAPAPGELTGRGHYRAGWLSGRRWAEEISANLAWFWDVAHAAGLSRDALIARAQEDEAMLPATLREEIHGTADGSGRDFLELLAYNLYRAGVVCDC